MNSSKSVNITGLMTIYNFEIEQLPESLKCTSCKLVLKDACQVPCGCRFCRLCIDDLMANGSEFCTGVMEDCRESLISNFVSDDNANESIYKLIVKCAYSGCEQECQLDNIEDHLRECQRKSVDCPYKDLGCNLNTLASEEIDMHLQQENRSHTEILMSMIAKINTEIEMMKQKDEASKKEIEMLKKRDEESKKEVDILKQRFCGNRKEVDVLKYRDEAYKKEFDMLKHKLVLKDIEISTIINRMVRVENENKLIAREKASFLDRVRIVTQKLDQEIKERQDGDQNNSASRVIDYVAREIAAITDLVASNKDVVNSETKSIKNDIRAINLGITTIRDDVCFMKSQLQTVQAPVGLGQISAKCDWLIDEDVARTRWGWMDVRLSEYFTTTVHPYKYRLQSSNVVGTTNDALFIYLRIYSSPNDGQLVWPFKKRVIMTVADKEHREVCKSISRMCKIDRPPDDGYRSSANFLYLHTDLREAGMNLSNGVRVTCEIIFSAARTRRRKRILPAEIAQSSSVFLLQ